MGLIRFFKGTDINEELKKYKDTADAVLVDVREKDEYRGGHIPGSVNVPLSTLADIHEVVPDAATPLFIYCLSGARSSQAESALKKMGYSDITNIGGISKYNGPVER